jgi:hypothetical protein
MGMLAGFFGYHELRKFETNFTCCEGLLFEMHQLRDNMVKGIHRFWARGEVYI